MPFTGNANYTAASGAAFAIEQSVKKDWSMIWTAGHPLLRALENAKHNWNRGFEARGLKMLLAVMGDEQANAPAGVTDANELTEMTLNTTDGFSQAAYEFVHIRGNYAIKESELTLLANGARGNILEGKKKQCLEHFKKVISVQLAGSQADARNTLPGLRHILATSNTVGGISQTTDPNWAALVTTGYGPFVLDAIEEKCDAIRALDRGEPDLVLAAYSSGGVNVYGKYRSAIAPAERYENKDFSVKYGLKNFMHMGLTVVLDNRGTSGDALILTTKTFFVYMPKKPKMHPIQRLPKTDAFEQVLTMWCAMGNNDPGINARVSGIS